MDQTLVDTLLEVINAHVFKVDLLSTIDVGGIGENADGHAGTGDVGKSVEEEKSLSALKCKQMTTHLTDPEKRLSRWGS